MQLMEKLLESLSLDELQIIRQTFAQNDKDTKERVFVDEITKLKEKLALEDEKAVQAAQEKKTPKENGNNNSTSSMWSDDERELLIKAVKVFPAGTSSRWEVIAEYINNHSKGNVVKTAKHVIKKVKELQKFDVTQIENTNKNAFAKFDKTVGSSSPSAQATLSPTKRDKPGEGASTYQPVVPVDKPWISEEQKLLENALRKYPSSTPERWEKIAAEVPGRTKKECMRRYKDLVEMVKAKKSVAAKSSKPS